MSAAAVVPAAIKIVIIDDHPITRSAVTDIIEQYDDLELAGSCGSVVGATELIKSAQPTLAIVDVTLEDGSGLELIRQLRRDPAIKASVKFLVFSAHHDTMMERRSIAAGASGFISKQAEVPHFVEALRLVLGGHRYFHGKPTNTNLRNELPDPDVLTNRELEVYALIGQGLGTSEIAGSLNLSVKTIETHKENIKNKLQLNSANELLRHAILWSIESQ